LSQLVVASALHTPAACLDHLYRGPFSPQLAAIETFAPLVLRHVGHPLYCDQQLFVQPYDHQMFAVVLPVQVLLVF
jgi:hypothetical protein